MPPTNPVASGTGDPGERVAADKKTTVTQSPAPDLNGLGRSTGDRTVVSQQWVGGPPPVPTTRTIDRGPDTDLDDKPSPAGPSAPVDETVPAVTAVTGPIQGSEKSSAQGANSVLPDVKPGASESPVPPAGPFKQAAESPTPGIESTPPEALTTELEATPDHPELPGPAASAVAHAPVGQTASEPEGQDISTDTPTPLAGAEGVDMSVDEPAQEGTPAPVSAMAGLAAQDGAGEPAPTQEPEKAPKSERSATTSLGLVAGDELAGITPAASGPAPADGHPDAYVDAVTPAAMASESAGAGTGTSEVAGVDAPAASAADEVSARDPEPDQSSPGSGLAPLLPDAAALALAAREGPVAPELASAGQGGPPSGVFPFRTRHFDGGRSVVFGLSAALFVAGLASIPHFLGSSSANVADTSLATAAVQSFPVTADADGTVVPASELGLNFGTSGELAQLLVTPGQRVSAGTVLARLDGSTQNDQVAKAESAVTAADAALAAAQSPLDPSKEAQLQASLQSAQSLEAETVSSVNSTASDDAAVVSADKEELVNDQTRSADDGCSTWNQGNALVCNSAAEAISNDQGQLAIDEAREANDASDGQLRITQAEQGVSQAESAAQAADEPDPEAVAGAQAQLSSAQAQLQTAQDQLAALTLVAPSAGTVLQVNGQVGETVSGASTEEPTLPGTTAPIPDVISPDGTTLSATNQPLIVLGSTGNWVIGAAFPAADAAQLSANQDCTITANTLSGLSVPCRVLGVAGSSTVVDGNAIVYAGITPTGSTTGLTSGLAVNVDVNVSQANNVLAVPQSAVFLVSGIPHVDVWNAGHTVSTVVSTGLQGASLIQITSGLTAGEQVVLSAYQGLPDSGSASPSQ